VSVDAVGQVDEVFARTVDSLPRPS
jgi:hypothetical protein